jgi:hypothetical protein
MKYIVKSERLEIPEDGKISLTQLKYQLTPDQSQSKESEEHSPKPSDISKLN